MKGRAKSGVGGSKRLVEREEDWGAKKTNVQKMAAKGGNKKVDQPLGVSQINQKNEGSQTRMQICP